MFCPKCATQNLEGASFCRVCGANISLVPQALTGQLTQPTDETAASCGISGRRRRGKEPTIDQAIRHVFMGFAFLLVAFALSFSIGRGWWFWMLIPAFSMMGTGVAQYIRFRDQEKRAFRVSPFQPAIQPPPRISALPERNTGEIVPPPSVTEGTTRHLGTEARTRHLDASNQPPG
jgi:zinc ribbon protein